MGVDSRMRRGITRRREVLEPAREAPPETVEVAPADVRLHRFAAVKIAGHPVRAEPDPEVTGRKAEKPRHSVHCDRAADHEPASADNANWRDRDSDLWGIEI